MNAVKCKDYFIIKIRCYADEKLLKKSRDEGGPLPKQHYERAEEFHNFIWKLIKKITKKGSDYWCVEYMMDGRMCALESIEESHGIIFNDGEGWATFMIPKKHNYVISWIKENILLPHKIVLKTNVRFLGWTKRDLKWRRKYAKEITDKIKSK